LSENLVADLFYVIIGVDIFVAVMFNGFGRVCRFVNGGVISLEYIEVVCFADAV
jgi:hypothetical protein